MYHPYISSARRVYTPKYSDGDLSFEQFLELAVQNCFYCESVPANRCNVRKKEGGNFVYNGLDRLDNSRRHDIDNVVPCCFVCNFARVDWEVSEFADAIKTAATFRSNKWNGKYANIIMPDILDIRKCGNELFSKYSIIIPNTPSIIHPNLVIGKLLVLSSCRVPARIGTRAGWLCRCECGLERTIFEYELLDGRIMSCGKQSCKRRKVSPFLSALRKVWKGHYTDGLSFDDFVPLSQIHCYYCGIAPSNTAKNYDANEIEIMYSGLDRVDNAKDHIIDNIVPCCIRCNMMKQDQSIQEFDEWLTKVSSRLDYIRTLIPKEMI